MSVLGYLNDYELQHLKPSMIIERIGKEDAQKMFSDVRQLIEEFKIEDEVMKSIQ